METETKTTPTLELRANAAWEGRFVLDQDDPTLENTGVIRRVDMTRDELQAVVQAAYDQFGILATPSYDAEAERLLDEPIPFTLADPGHCPCGMEGCSDRAAARAGNPYLQVCRNQVAAAQERNAQAGV